MIETRLFYLGDILSIITDQLLSPTGLDGVYDIMNYMTDDKLSTHQLPRAMRECRPHILAQHPDLEEIDVTGVNGENLQQWLKEQSAKYGEQLEIKPLVSGIYKRIDRVEEAGDIAGPDKVIKIDLNKTKGSGPIDPRLN